MLKAWADRVVVDSVTAAAIAAATRAREEVGVIVECCDCDVFCDRAPSQKVSVCLDPVFRHRENLTSFFVQCTYILTPT